MKFDYKSAIAAEALVGIQKPEQLEETARRISDLSDDATDQGVDVGVAEAFVYLSSEWNSRPEEGHLFAHEALKLCRMIIEDKSYSPV